MLTSKGFHLMTTLQQRPNQWDSRQGQVLILENPNNGEVSVVTDTEN